jgi:hypothetical protein
MGSALRPAEPIRGRDQQLSMVVLTLAGELAGAITAALGWCSHWVLDGELLKLTRDVACDPRLRATPVAALAGASGALHAAQLGDLDEAYRLGTRALAIASTHRRARPRSPASRPGSAARRGRPAAARACVCAAASGHRAGRSGGSPRPVDSGAELLTPRGRDVRGGVQHQRARRAGLLHNKPGGAGRAVGDRVAGCQVAHQGGSRTSELGRFPGKSSRSTRRGL